jgi:hypothetical protein
MRRLRLAEKRVFVRVRAFERTGCDWPERNPGTLRPVGTVVLPYRDLSGTGAGLSA